MQDMSWLRDRRGTPYKLHGAGFSCGSCILGDVLSWSSIQPGVTRFSPCIDIATQSIAKRRRFGPFCLTLAYNFPSIMYRVLPQGALVACSAKIHQHPEWLLDNRSATLSHFYTGIRGGTTIVESTLGCDRAAIRYSKTPVHFGAHPALSRVVHRWAGSRRWKPRKKKLKKLITNCRLRMGEHQRDSRILKHGF